MASERFKAFITDLSLHPENVDALRSDPDGFLGATNLSEEEKALIQSGDSYRISQAFADELEPRPPLIAIVPDVE